MLEDCGSSLLWRFLPVDGVDKWLVKVSWLGKLVSVFWWVELDIFSLECNECPVVSLSVYGFGVIFDRLYFCAQGYVPVLLEN